MEGPFYGKYWSHPRYSSNLRGIPVHHNPTATKPAPKVVQIPVHFVGSDPNPIWKPEHSRSASASKIQRVFRGYLVRKYMMKIISIKKQVDEIEWKLSCGETVELIRKDERERLRVNETLMSLLLKLDSIRGFDSGVRDCRKAVIKKAICLQEKVDSIVTASVQSVAAEKGGDDAAPAMEKRNEVPDSMESGDVETELEGEGDDVARGTEERDNVPNSTENDEKQELGGEDDVGLERGEVLGRMENEEETEFKSKDDVALANEKRVEVPNDGEMKLKGGDDMAVAIEGPDGVPKCMENDVDDVSPGNEKRDEVPSDTDNDVKGGEKDAAREMIEVTEEINCCPMDECVIEGSDDEERIDESRRNRELLEKMVEENGKMMRMMNELCKKNEVQTRMLNSLTQRVEQLERAFVCDRLKKKKKRNPA